ncbi:DNA internalization-related competence protein ComEC/Rec2 [Acinetobacter haemolyticus]|uniref:DNA internalization-related competence protein ComEC/Rec2 n=1 Tax=Acinetobacter haemolyticus TaxID=29430 RepID=UPI000D68697E|nr:DNA internalization-related competence protein ComEC/Rec2 [Acinetobacter haemolyticus]
MLKIILLGWVAGVALMGINIPIITTTWWFWLIIAIAIFGFGFYWKKQYFHHPAYKALLLISTTWALFCAGYHYADIQLQQRLIFKEQSIEPFEAIVYVKKISELNENGEKQIAEVLNRHVQSVDWFLHLSKEKDAAKVTPEFKLGHYYRISGQIRPAHSYAVPGAFDLEKWFLQQNVQSGFSVRNIQPIHEDELYDLGYYRHLQQQQSYWAKCLLAVEKKRLAFRQMLQASTFQHKGLLLALLTGDESLLSDDVKQQFQQLGISHLLAISGPHVLVFALMLTWLLQKLIQHYCPNIYLKYPRQLLLLIPFIFSVLLYVAFVGFEIPAMRTLLTVSIVSIFMCLRQSIQAFSVLVYSASLLLVLDPFSILSAAFWLSYGACFILLRIYQTILQLPQNVNLTFKQKFIWGGHLLIESQWKIFVALLPLVLIFFQQVSWFAPLTNLIAIPLLSVCIVPLDILAACIWLIIPILGQWLFQMNDVLLSFLMLILNVLQSISPHLYGISFTPWMMLSVILGMFLLFLPRGVIPKFWAGVCFLPILWGVKAQSEALHILDVGQGQAILVQHSRGNILIDTGGSFDEAKFSMGERVVIPFLRQQGIRRLEHVVLTHLDQDHSGAFTSIQNRFEIDLVQSNEKHEKMQFKENFSFCHQGQKWSFPNMTIQILFPQPHELSYAKDQKNEYSCVLYVQFLDAQPYQNFLIMGDAGWETEYKLLQQYPDLKVDVLILGHHGSKHSSAYEFLETLKPQLTIASAGFNNRYGHPSQQVLNRLQHLNIPILNTADTGTISFMINNQDGVLLQHRQQRKWLSKNSLSN